MGLLSECSSACEMARYDLTEAEKLESLRRVFHLFMDSSGLMEEEDLRVLCRHKRATLDGAAASGGHWTDKQNEVLLRNNVTLKDGKVTQEEFETFFYKHWNGGFDL